MSFDLALERGDLKINRDGTVKTVSGNSKIRQDIIKILSYVGVTIKDPSVIQAAKQEEIQKINQENT